MTDTDDAPAPRTNDEKILEEARERFLRCREWQSEADAASLDDDKFANADPRNGWQWPDKMYASRNDEQRPTLTINKVRVHNNMIINEALKNKSSIKIRPTGGQASYEGSQAMQAIIRRIEYISKADSIYETAIRHQVDSGIGYVLIDTDFVNERSFDQEIYLRRCRDPRGVYLDPDIMQSDGSDAKFGFVFEPKSKKAFNRKYPKFKDSVGETTLDNMNWLRSDQIMQAMYHRRNDEKDKLLSYISDDGKRVDKLASEIKDDAGRELFDMIVEQIKNGEIEGRMRNVVNQKVEWFLIVGNNIVERGDWAGRYVPICRCVGVETVIEGKYDRKGHTRQMIDAQRMLNYNASGSVEFGALQNKVPYIGPADAFEGQEQWKDANRKNYAFLQYRHIDEEGNPIPAPQRQEPPQTAPVYMQGMQDAERQMMAISGQFQAQLGEDDKQSASSGKAINERQRQGDTATYHFVEHQSDMLRFVGVQLLDLIPKIYDTERELHVLGDDGTKRWLKIAPDQEEALVELKEEKDEAAIIAFNPAIGEYDCMSDTGPNYATQRQEAWNAVSIILQQNMQLAGTIGDLLFKFGDFPGADEIMDRLKKEIKAQKPYLFDDQNDPQVANLKQQTQKLTALNAELMQKLGLRELALKGRDERRDIEANRAQTDRMKVTLDFMTKVMLQPNQQQDLEHELMKMSHDTAMQMLIDTNASELQTQANGAVQ